MHVLTQEQRSEMRNNPIKMSPRFIKVDLNNYECPCCTSPYFKVGADDGHLTYVECLKNHCKHKDYIQDKIVNLKDLETKH